MKRNTGHDSGSGVMGAGAPALATNILVRLGTAPRKQHTYYCQHVNGT